MYPKPMDFKFYQESIRFILVLAAIALVGMSFTIYIMTKYHVRVLLVVLVLVYGVI